MSTRVSVCIVLLFLICTACSGPGSSLGERGSVSAKACTEPENPYGEGSGHYAGFEWAEREHVSSCGGNSQSFIEGCQESLRQSTAYEACAEER